MVALFPIEGSSSVGAVNAPFLAAFSAATGKRSLQFSESEESDPDVSVNNLETAKDVYLKMVPYCLNHSLLTVSVGLLEC